MALPLVVGQGLDFGLACKQVHSFRFRLTAQQGPGASPETNPTAHQEPSESGVWSFSEDRLADLAAQLEPQASVAEPEEPRYGRLFF